MSQMQNCPMIVFLKRELGPKETWYTTYIEDAGVTLELVDQGKIQLTHWSGNYRVLHYPFTLYQLERAVGDLDAGFEDDDNWVDLDTVTGIVRSQLGSDTWTLEDTKTLLAIAKGMIEMPEARVYAEEIAREVEKNVT